MKGGQLTHENVNKRAYHDEKDAELENKILSSNVHIIIKEERSKYFRGIFFTFFNRS